MIGTFEACAEVNFFLAQDQKQLARDKLIRILDRRERDDKSYSELINHLARKCGLFPYIQPDEAMWEDRLAYEMFKVDTGSGELRTLHIEQSRVLKALLNGESLALSAPTSFGKSFIIDSFIAAKKPNVVLIIVPTIALADETRRRLYKKFSRDYQIITTADVTPDDRPQIMIFPQERALAYSANIKSIDILIVDEFYKASSDFDKERSPSLLRALMKFGKIAKQRYFLAPNISEIVDNPFTAGMRFEKIDFNTVILEVNHLYSQIDGDERRKAATLKKLMRASGSKTLIYAGSYPNIDKVSNELLSYLPESASELLASFAQWLEADYGPGWQLPKLITRGVGVHNGQLHRSLSQIQIKLFEEDQGGLDTIISTSSIIEGVNTCAERVILWRNKNGSANLTNFAYKNLIGRSGRMFRHFIGKVYVLESPPSHKDEQLQIELPDSLLGHAEIDNEIHELTQAQTSKVATYRTELKSILGEEIYARISQNGEIQTSDMGLVKKIAEAISTSPEEWRALAYLNSSDVGAWENSLYRIINLSPAGWDGAFRKLVGFVKVLAGSWEKTIPELAVQLDQYDIGVNEMFAMERKVTFKLASLLGDVNLIHAAVVPHRGFDITPFIFSLSHAFLPPAVYHLEEYGLPRMTARRIQRNGRIDFLEAGMDTQRAIRALVERKKAILLDAEAYGPFELYLTRYFFDGLTPG